MSAFEQPDPPAGATRGRIVVGTGAEARDIAVETRPGRDPGLFWLGGFRSDMFGSKALALDATGARLGLSVTRFDYSGHGISGGDFEKGTISRWLEEVEAVYGTPDRGRIAVGSSMGGWIALLLARRKLLAGTPLSGLVLIAPAADMTHELMLPGFSAAERADLETLGHVDQPSAYSDTPYRITRALIEDGEQHRLFGKPIETGCPIVVLQGGQDPDVPQAHAIRLVTHLLHDPVTLTLIPDGDHRLSRPQDLALLDAAIERLVGHQG
jgi:pimeloyl-ACP methyl ester carboxylesterase